MDGFRKFIISTAEVMMVIVVGIMTIGIAISTAGTMGMMMGGAGWILGFLIGGGIGFVIASVIAAYFFLLREIAENTRRIH